MYKINLKTRQAGLFIRMSFNEQKYCVSNRGDQSLLHTIKNEHKWLDIYFTRSSSTGILYTGNTGDSEARSNYAKSLLYLIKRAQT